jgi:Uma2 family endonuclease
MTLDEFLAWDPPGPAGRTWQLIDGEPVAMAPANTTHAALQAEISRVLGNHLLAQGSPCQVQSQPGIVPRLRSSRNYRVPDLGVTCAPPQAAPMMPEPVLLFEILSPSNEAETRANIWAYASISSVIEILAVHATRIEAELLRRDAHGGWPEQPDMIGAGGTLELRSIGFSGALRALYRTTALKD